MSKKKIHSQYVCIINYSNLKQIKLTSSYSLTEEYLIKIINNVCINKYSNSKKIKLTSSYSLTEEYLIKIIHYVCIITYSNSKQIKSTSSYSLLEEYLIFKVNCPPPFRREADGYCFRFSVVLGAGLGTLSLQLLLQFKADPFETLHVL